VIGHNPLEVYMSIWQGAFRDIYSISSVTNLVAVLIVVSSGLLITFAGGYWNIGIEGQMVMGAIFASGAALHLNLPSLILVPIEIILAMIGGALWALLAAVLKTRLGVHEIFSGVALNAIANVFLVYLISGPWQPSEGGSAHSTAPFSEIARLHPISPRLNISLVMLILAIGSFALVVYIIRKTHWGLSLKAVGLNPKSALLLGVNPNTSVLSAFVFCGALAGIAGSQRVLFVYGSLRPEITGGIGFLGLLVVLLAFNKELLVPLVSLVFTVTVVGSTRLKTSLRIDHSMADTIQSLIVLSFLITSGIRKEIQNGD